jgi:uncharacterized protein DUF5615
VSDSIRWYMDEHVPLAVTQGLRRLGIDVLTSQEAGMLGAEDVDHLAYALSAGRAVFTQDADFLRLHAAGALHAGIVYVPQQTPIGTMVRGLEEVVTLISTAEIVQRVIFL